MKQSAHQLGSEVAAPRGASKARLASLMGTVLGLLLGVCSCGNHKFEPLVHQGLFDEEYDATPRDLGKLEIEPPPFSEGVFPCTDCHEPDLPVKGTRRTLKVAHQEILLEHDAENRWCLDCHSIIDFDKLHLASGELIDFEESHRLCGQCHGDKHRDWRLGIHGRRSGNWDGEKTYLLCVHCHYSHRPAFQPLAPMPAPKRPQRTP